MHEIPAYFVRKMLAFHGITGIERWLDRLPTILATCEERWDLTLAPPFANLSYNYVAPAVHSDGTPVVVKACLPTGEFRQESEALRLFAGRGMVQLLAYDQNDEVLLLESLRPGLPLSTLGDDVLVTSHAAAVMRQLWRPLPSHHPFPSVFDWGRGFTRLRQRYQGGNGPFPAALLAEAESLFAELSASISDLVLLHGDLHHDNILSSTRQPWLAIDPKGLVGEPAYETGSLLRNRLPQVLTDPDAGRILARRVDQLAEELNLDRTRIRGWGLSQAVLSAWWSVEDSGSIPATILPCAELLARIKD